MARTVELEFFPSRTLTLYLARLFVTRIVAVLIMLVLVAVNGPLVLAVLFALWVGWRCRGAIPAEILILALMTFIYLGGTSLLPGLPRYTAVMWPWLGLSVAAVLARHMRVTLQGGGVS